MTIRQSAGSTAFAQLGTFLREDGWKPRQIDERHVYQMQFLGKHGQYTCFAEVRTDLEELIVYAVAPLRVAPDHYQAAAEFVTRANYGLRIGNFEFGFDDGQVQFKSSLNFEGIELTNRLIKNTLHPAVITLDVYLPGLAAVVNGTASPRDAIMQIEQDQPLTS